MDKIAETAAALTGQVLTIEVDVPDAGWPARS
jgi:hypothetical protein